MSKVAIIGNASGTGVFTVASPNSNVDRVLTLPDETGTVITTATPGVPVNGPAFSAYAGATTALANATWTKVLFNTEYFDTNSNFAASTFTPTIAGYYQINATIGFPVTVGLYIAIYKNGAQYNRASGDGTSAVLDGAGSITALVSMNGSTDYIDIYAYSNSNGSTNTSAGASNQVSGFLARSAL